MVTRGACAPGGTRSKQFAHHGADQVADDLEQATLERPVAAPHPQPGRRADQVAVADRQGRGGVIAAGIVREDEPEVAGRGQHVGQPRARCRRARAVSANHTVGAAQVVPHGGVDGVRVVRGTPATWRSAMVTMLGWTSPSTQVSRPPAAASAPAIIRSGLWCTAIGQGSGRAGNSAVTRSPQVGRPELDPPGAWRQIQDRRPALPQRAHRRLDELRRVEQRVVDEQPEVGERHDVGAERGGPLPVGLLEVPRVQRAAGRGEPPRAVEHQRQRRAQAIQGVRAQPHRVAAQALLIGERPAGVELSRPPGRREAGQPGERRLQAGHGRGDPLRVTGRAGQFVPGGGQLVQGLFGRPADAVVGDPRQQRPHRALGPEVLRGHVDLPGQPAAVGQPRHQREDLRDIAEPGRGIGEHRGRDLTRRHGCRRTPA